MSINKAIQKGGQMKNITYCTSTDCPSPDCAIKVLNNKFQPGDIISMGDFSLECRYYIGWVLSRIEEE